MGDERVLTNDPDNPIAAVGDADIALVGAGIRSSVGNLTMGVPGITPPLVRVNSITGLLETSIDGTFWGQVASGASGTVDLDFGSVSGEYPPGGSNATHYVVTGQLGITSNCKCEAWMLADSTRDHNVEEHKVVPVKLTCGDIVQGDGFTIYAVSDWRLNGTFKVAWRWQY